MCTDSPVKFFMMLTHRHFLVEKEKMVCKTIDNLEK